jgi:hypothetical protein
MLADDHTHRWSRPPTGDVFSQSIYEELCGEAVAGIDPNETAKTQNSGFGIRLKVLTEHSQTDRFPGEVLSDQLIRWGASTV